MYPSQDTMSRVVAFAALAAGICAASFVCRQRSGSRSKRGNTASVQKNEGPRSYLIVHNMAKRTNIGNIIRSCSAFGVDCVLVAGRKKNTTFYGAKGTKSKVNIKYFASLKQVREHCVSADIAVCGIEIMDNASPVHKHPWSGSTAFILGNEGTGLTQAEKDICDSFV